MEIDFWKMKNHTVKLLNNIENNNCFLNQIEIILQAIENDEVK